MKKRNLIVSLAAITTTGITPVIALASCGKSSAEDINSIPEDMLDIQSNVLYGLKEGASIDAYDTLAIPEDVIAISNEAFKDAFKEDANGSTIKTIILNKNLSGVGKNAFMGCDAITKLDLTKMDSIKIMALKLGSDSFTTWKNSGGSAVLPEGTTDMQKECIKEIFNNAGLPKSWFGEIQPEEQQNADTINNIIKDKNCQTFYDVVEACKDTIDVETIEPDEGHTYIWDQIENRIVIIDSETQELVYGPNDKPEYTLNESKWQLWKRVDEESFDSYSQYSQYLKKPTETNGLTKTNYSFISGFDCGYNTDVKNVHYFYEKVDEGEEQKAKDRIIINTNSINTNVDISAYNSDSLSTSDTVTHFGQMGELTIVSSNYYSEHGKVITATVFDGTVDISGDEEAGINLTYVRSEHVTLTNYTPNEDLVYAETAEIEQALEDTGVTVEAVKDEDEYQTEIKEPAIEAEGGTVQHVFTVTGGAQNEYYDSFSAIAAASNDSVDPEFFENKTITLNKDYDMAVESANWVPICNYDDDTGSLGKAFLGTIDGQGHTILNFNLNVSTGNPGLINTNAGSVKNLNFKNCSLNNSAGRACLVAVWNRLGDMTFENLNFYNCNVTSQRSNGFAFGYVTGTETTATFKNCYTDEQCWVKGTTYHYLYQTGFVSQICDGVSSALFENCEMHYKVQSVYCAGSYIGQLGSVNSLCPNVTFKNCTSYGDVVCIEGAFAGNGPMMGGFVGSCQNNAQTETEPSTVLFDHCTNYSNVYSEDKFVNIDSLGGFIGYGNNPKKAGALVSFVDCVNEGNIGKENEQTEYVPNYSGGFFGRTNGNENITISFTRCENKGYINATTAGHFMGLLDYTTEAILAKRTCSSCTISGSLRTGATRTKITGEP